MGYCRIMFGCKWVTVVACLDVSGLMWWVIVVVCLDVSGLLW